MFPSTRYPAAKTGILVAIVLVVSLNLRPALTCLGPVSDLVAASTGMTTSQIGMLASIPIFCMGVGALITPRIIRAIGMDTTVWVAMAAIGSATLVRAFVPGAGMWIGTVAVGVSIGVLNTVLPAVIKRDFPMASSRVMGVYSASLTFGSGIASGLAVPIAGVSTWRVALGVWAAFAGIGLLAWGYSLRVRGSRWLPSPARQDRRDVSGGARAVREVGVDSGRAVEPVWELDVSRGAQDRERDGSLEKVQANAGRVSARRVWASPIAWAATFFMGLQSFLFYTCVQWLPDLQKMHGLSAEHAGANMFTFQIAGILATLTLTALQGERQDQRIATIVTSCLWGGGMLGVLFAPAMITVWVLVMGLGSGASFSLALSFIATRTHNAEQASQMSGMSQSFGYAIASIGPTVVGALVSSAGWNTALHLMFAVVLVIFALGLYVGRPVKISVQ